MDEEKFQQLAIDLANKSIGKVSPRPPVGAVIVKDGKVVGQGRTKISPGDHAEAEAITEASNKANGATLYCTLEPHNFFSKDEACTKKIIDSGIVKVSCPTIDINPKVNGNGFEELRNAGIELENNWNDYQKKQCEELYESYNFKILNNRPLISIKLAMTLDGKIATKNNDSKWITNEKSRLKGHELRGISDAIITGINTIISDDPKMNSRGIKIYEGNPKYRVILDNDGKLNKNHQIYKDKNLGKIVWFTGKSVDRSQLPDHIIHIKSSKIKIEINDVIKELDILGCNSILIEAGGTLAGSFFDKRLVDKVYAFISPSIFGGKKAPNAIEGEGIDKIKERINLKISSIEQLDEDILIIGRTH